MQQRKHYPQPGTLQQVDCQQHGPRLASKGGGTGGAWEPPQEVQADTSLYSKEERATQRKNRETQKDGQLSLHPVPLQAMTTSA